MVYSLMKMLSWSFSLNPLPMQQLKLIPPLLVLFLLSLPSCDWGRCGGDYYFYGNLFGFNVLDGKTRQNVLEVGQINYGYDTVKVYHENWDVAYAKPVPGDGMIFLQFIDEVKDKGVVNTRIARRFYMYFNYQNVDTLDIAFEMKYDKCHNQRMKYFKVAYNDSVYFDGPTDRAGTQNFLK